MIGEVITLSLTGKDSHKVSLQPGQGSISIGTIGISKGNFNVWVEENNVINWDAFNGFYAPAHLQEKEKYPYGDWPRFFYYSGNDMGFIEWSSKRKIEEFTWFPQKDIKVNFENSNIYNLFISTNNKIELVFGSKVLYLDLYGNLDNYMVKKCEKVPSLGFWPDYGKNIKSYKLPIYDAFRDAKELQITVDVNMPPFDCTSLLQFPNLELLHLNGNMTNLYALNELKKLKKIGLWNVPNLSDLPHVNVWKNLNNFVAVNVEEKSGKRLRKQLAELKKTRKLEFSAVSKLRDASWFETSYGIPFSKWESKNEKKAIRIYNSCLKKVKEAKIENDIKKAIVEFTEKFNKFDDIEAIERDDIYNALCKIMKASTIHINEEKWHMWFDEKRDF